MGSSGTGDQGGRVQREPGTWGRTGCSDTAVLFSGRCGGRGEGVRAVFTRLTGAHGGEGQGESDDRGA